MKKVLAFLLVICMLSALAACGAAVDPNRGIYRLESVQGDGATLKNEVYIELFGGGKAVLHIDDSRRTLHWTLDGTAFHAEGDGTELDGTLEEGRLVIDNLLNTGYAVSFFNRDYGNPQVPAPVSASENPYDADTYAWWRGKWYGWAAYYQGSGVYALLEGRSWDVVAEISVESDVGTLEIRNALGENYPELDAKVHFQHGSAPHGMMVCTSGSFGSFALSNEQWSSNPGSDPEGKLEHTFSFTFHCQSPDNAEDSFQIYYVLRPWGMDWEDVRTADTYGMVYKNMMPVHYEDWYLPQLRAEAANPAGDPSVLYGQWAHISGYTYEFREDGTGCYSLGDSRMDFTYTVAGNLLSILFTGNTQPFETTFRIEGKKLIMLDSSGEDVIYTAK